MEQGNTAADILENARVAQSEASYLLRLYVTGATPRSTQAIANIRAICDELLPGRYELEVIDIYQLPYRVRDEQIVAIPTLVKAFPLPFKRLVGDLSDMEQVLAGLDIHPSTAVQEEA